MAIVAQVKDVKTAVHEAAMKAAQTLTLSLRDKAAQAGWPADIVVQLSVVAVDGDLRFDYPEELSSKVEDLEYGTVNSTPSAVLRPFEARFVSDIAEMMDSEYLDALYDMGAFN